MTSASSHSKHLVSVGVQFQDLWLLTAAGQSPFHKGDSSHQLNTRGQTDGAAG